MLVERNNSSTALTTLDRYRVAAVANDAEVAVVLKGLPGS